MSITYFDRKTEVRLGDRVSLPVWFFGRHTGRVIYIPGISALSLDFEHHELRWVGIRLDDGSLVATVVDPEGDFLVKRKVLLVQRDSSSIDHLIAREGEFEEDS